jgi:hypothetical protein
MKPASELARAWAKAFTPKQTIIKSSRNICTFRVGKVLAALGLPRQTRWPVASRRIKALLIQSRNAEDLETCQLLSEAKAFLRRNLPSECQDCGAVIAAQNIKCRRCYK